MRLTLFNGSPRGEESNTALLLSRFRAGLEKSGSHEVTLAHLARIADTEKHVRLFREAEHVLLAMPLYTDAMPGIVKHFMEALGPCENLKKKPCLGFIVQSGFPEPVHSRVLEGILKAWAERLGCRYTGTAVRGGVEGIRTMPDRMTRKLFKRFEALGFRYGKNGVLDPEIIRLLAKRERLPGPVLFFARLLQNTGLFDHYWNMQLKANAAYERRFDRPYEPQT